MKKNVVFIETISSTGSGILYPCNYNFKNKKNNTNYYIVFTNMHVLNDIQSKSNPYENVKGLVFIHIYDDFGRLIEENDILSIISFCPDIKKINKSEDISAMLVAIKDTRLITLETNISSNSLTNREVIFLEGYPGIMLDDDISPKIQLQGLIKNGFPESDKMGVFQVSDDYHWYNNLYDLYLFKGMSGGPVYRDQDGKTSLLGMIQSVSALEEGQNPFKLVYYLRIEFILEFLRSAGCIIFKKVSETEYLIEWIYGMKEEISEYENAPTFLLIGGSGAGKSSFAKDFAYHGSNLLTTNDGQTTRTTVAYEYSIFCDEPKAHVEFMNQKEFNKRISLLQGANPILSLIQKLYTFNENLVKNEADFLENFCCFLEELKTREKNSVKTIALIEAYLDSKRRGKEFEVKDAFEIYERLLVILIRYIPNSYAKLIFDVKWIESIKKQYEDSYEKQYGSKDEKKVFVYELLEKEIRITEKEVGSEWRVIIDKYFNEELSWREYRNMMIKFILNDDIHSKKEHQRKLKTIELLDDVKTEYIKKLLYIDGFFDIQEFFFLDSIKELKLLESFLGNPFPKMESNKNAIEGREGFEIDFWRGTQDVYKNVYQEIKKSICEEYSISPNNFQRTFNLTLLDDRNKKELQFCLQVASGKSLTGLIRHVKIEDMISNDHAMTLYELKIAKIKMYDTYGLDHVEGMKSIEETLYSYIYQMNEYGKIRYKDINLLYFKKLDAGRPDELKVVLPCVRKVIPQAPVYCVFTGIDIFYKNSEEIKNLQWKTNNEKVPKSVRYILSDRAGFALNDGEYIGNRKNRSMYLVLRNNLVPYCGDKKKVQNEYYYMKNNEVYIKRMLASIVMKEYSSIEIVDLEYFRNLSEDKKKKIDDFIMEIFKRASVNVDGVHWNTIRANISRMDKDKLGAWTSYRYQWNQRFHEAYTYAVEKFGTELARQFCGSEDAIESALKNVEDSFLGTAENLYKISLQHEEKNNFRIYMEEMYEDGYEYNPYMTGQLEFKSILNKSKLRKSYFLDVFNFAKGLKSNESLLRKFTDEFIDKLYEELQNDNKIKVKNIIHLNPSFADSVEAIKTEFIEKYKLDKDDEGKVEKDFKRILQAYIANL